ncbi:MAG: hypothetical protein PHG14_11135 [Desulfobacter postgatei]|uniref:hypothetical protein n=1 Tax=Desulfobacter postgatei TaxID=2293 RepID=UPI0023F0C43A|nr:hypothetical protein [Desulfobacter postgatei]MDD4274267.1 hypothetical protein [Desulfobacter postgatei]
MAKDTNKTLAENFKNAKKLAELKDLAQEWDCFKDLDLDQYKGLQGPKLLKADMLKVMPEEARKQLETPPKPTKKAKPTDKGKQTIMEYWKVHYGKPEHKGIKVAREIETKTGQDIDTIYRTIAALAKKAV